MKPSRERAIEILACGGALSGIQNCHLPGLYSIVLENRKSRDEGMLRIFYASEECKMGRLLPDIDFNLAPHNHRQDISLYHLFGSALNVDLVEGRSVRCHEYVFKSALIHGKFGLDYSRPVSFDFSFRFIEKDGIHLKAQDVHTVLAKPKTAWVIQEGAQSDIESLFYSLTEDKDLHSDGLYIPMDADHISRISNEILANLSETPNNSPLTVRHTSRMVYQGSKE